jgi:uncharacterized protein (TIGR00290 family)
VTTRPRALVSWSSGKDSAFALHDVIRAGHYEVLGLLTTVTPAFGRVSVHGVRAELLLRQAAAAGLPSITVELPYPCSNEVYQRLMAETLRAVREAEGITHVIFGDLFLADVRAYREAQLASLGLQGVFPLWMRDTAVLAREMIAVGMSARIVALDPRRLDRAFAGRAFDAACLDVLPTSVDPCGENGEFHTCVTAGPMFRHAISVTPGEVVERDGMVFADLLPM